MTEQVLDAFVTAVIAASDYEEMDRIYLKNRVMSRIGEEGLDAPAHQADLIHSKISWWKSLLRIVRSKIAWPQRTAWVRR